MGSFSVWHWLVALVLIGVFILPNIFYILSMQKALAAIDQDKRPIAPGLAWLYLIPIFNIVWIYFLVVYISRGYARMGEAGRLSRPTAGGFGVGLAFAICLSLTLVPGLNLLAIIPMIVLWILHWVQVHSAQQAVIRT
jgi:hypothetical protein